MNSRKFVLRETLTLLIGEVICSAAMVGLFALLQQFSLKVILGAVFGIVLAVGNFLFMAIFSESAADRAAEQDVKGGKAAIKASYGFRMVVLGVLLIVLAKTGICNVIALVCPLFFVFPILVVVEFFRKSGGKTA